MRYVALASSIVILLWVFFAFKLGYFESRYGLDVIRARHQAANIITVIGVLLLTALFCYSAWVAYTPPKEIWWVCLAMTLGVVAVGGTMLAINDTDTTFLSLATIIIVIALMLTGSIAKIADDNAFRVSHGTVIEHEFVAAYVTVSCVKTICSSTYHPDDWKLLVRECDRSDGCQDGWLHFSSDVFGMYPVGSTYPALQ